jgi:hypothetical protein
MKHDGKSKGQQEIDSQTRNGQKYEKEERIKS